MNVGINPGALPEPLRHFSGRILDPDTHEMMPEWRMRPGHLAGTSHAYSYAACSRINRKSALRV